VEVVGGVDEPVEDAFGDDGLGNSGYQSMADRFDVSMSDPRDWRSAISS
jgi:hypothetical protein